MSDQEVPPEKGIAQGIVNEPDSLLSGLPIVGVTPIAVLPKTSAVILNWSRFSNVLLIVASLSTTEGIDEILIWNNNPQKLSHEEGASSRLVENIGSDSLWSRTSRILGVLLTN